MFNFLDDMKDDAMDLFINRTFDLITKLGL